MNRGILAALAAYTTWGLLPVFWKLLAHVPALETLAHRLVWSLVVVLLILGVRGHWRWLKRAVASRKILLTFFVTAGLIGVNWLTYIWAVNNNQIVEASLGYFINPLVSVFLGVVVLKERLRRTQWFPISITLIGVLYLTFNHGRFPWIALTLAFTFGLYGLLRKTAQLQALEGFALEIIILVAPALFYLVHVGTSRGAAFTLSQPLTVLLLIMTGVVTALPMILFAYGARRIPLTTLGILQYIGPSLQFTFGVFVYGEPFNQTRLIGFVIIWVSILLYTLEGLVQVRKRRALAASAKV